jgi:hypothetical protein
MLKVVDMILRLFLSFYSNHTIDVLSVGMS